MNARANITRLDATLFTGGDLPMDTTRAVADIAEWRMHGIDRVVDCRAEWSDHELVAAHAPEIDYAHLGIHDVGQHIPGVWFDELVAAVDPDVVTLVHCHMGINRGPSAAYALLLARGHDPVDAIRLIRTRRPIAAVSYAEDALEWRLDRTGADEASAHRTRARLAAWRRANPHDTVRIIREIRAAS